MPCKGGQVYCDEHLVPKCLALTKKKKPCKTPPISSRFPFCDAHKHLGWELGSMNASSSDESSDGDTMSFDDKEEMVLEPSPEESPRLICSATTKKGRPCKGPALPGKQFCFDHDLTNDSRPIPPPLPGDKNWSDHQLPPAANSPIDKMDVEIVIKEEGSQKAVRANSYTQRLSFLC